MSIKCGSCGLVNFADAANCRRCGVRLRAEPEVTAASPSASDRVVLGPVFTNAGFKSWHLVCLTDALIAVPQGAIEGFLTSAAPTGALFGLLGALASIGGTKAAQDAAALLRDAPGESLRSNPNHVIHRLSELKSITFRRPALSNPEIRIESATRGTTVYGVTNPAALPSFVEPLRKAYPRLCSA